MTIAEKITRAKTDYDEVYEAGKQAGGNTGEAFEEGKQAAYDELWDSLQTNGERTVYEKAFGSPWNDGNFRPKHSMIPVNANHMFGASAITDLQALLDECGVTLDFSKVSYNRLTQWLQESKITRVGTVDLTSLTNATYVFYAAKSLVTIEKLIFAETNVFSNTWFQQSANITNINAVEGTIASNGFNVSYCPKLTHDSLMRIINVLKDYSGSGTTYTITFGSDNIAKLTEEEILIANRKGWDIA